MSTGTLTPVGSLVTLIDQLVKIEETVHPDLEIIKWQPVNIEPPSLFNWLATGTFQIMDQARWRDDITIMARIAVKHEEGDMDSLMMYADAFRNVMDDALYNQRPLRANATWAERQGMNMAAYEFNGVSYLGIEFPLRFRLDRRITPNA